MIDIRKLGVAIFLFFTVLNLNACNNVENIYKEQQIELPDSINTVTDIVKTNDGKIIVSGMNENNEVIGIWELKNTDNKWQQVLDLREQIPEQLKFEDISISLNTEGSGVMSLGDDESGHTFLINDDGTLTELDRAIQEIIDNEMVATLYKLDDKKLLALTNMGECFIIDCDKASTTQIKIKDIIYQYHVEEDKIYYLTDKGILCTDKNGEKVNIDDDFIVSVNKYIENTEVEYKTRMGLSVEGDDSFALLMTDKEMMCFSKGNGDKIVDRNKIAAGDCKREGFTYNLTCSVRLQ